MSAAWKVRMWPFSRLAADLGCSTSPAVTTQQQTVHAGADRLPGNSLAVDVRWAVSAWSRAWPWPPTCLMQAVAARQLLVAHDVACDLVFGVRGQAPSSAPSSAPSTLPSSPDIGAHAWLLCGGLTVTGEAEAARFQPIAVYRFSPGDLSPPP